MYALIGQSLLGALAMGMGSLVGRVLIALGISYVTYTGLDVLFSNLLNQMNSNLGALPSDLLGWMGILKIQTSISIITSAFSTRMAMAAVSGTIKKAVLK